MGGGIETLILVLVMVLNGSGRDLLDYVSSDAYWKQKHVEVTPENMLAELRDGAGPAIGDLSPLIKQLGDDEFKVREAAATKIRAAGPGAIPQLKEGLKSSDGEVVSRCRELIKVLAGEGKAGEVRRLMAIRTLGELKNKDALPRLKKLMNSKDPFVGDYAAAAVAAIEGREYQRPELTAADRMADVMLLPGDVGVVVQFNVGEGGEPANLQKLVQAMGLDRMMGIRPPGGGAPNAADRKAAQAQAVQKIQDEIISAADQMGNVRLDGLTMGIAESVGDHSGYVMTVAHGQFDPAALGMLTANMHHEAVDGTEVYSQGDSSVIIPAPGRLIFLMGPNKEALPLTEVVAAVNAGKGKMDGNAEMVKLIKTVDTTKPVWAAARIGENYRQSTVLAGFETITATATRNKTGGMTLAAEATASDAAKAGASVDEFQKGLATAIKEVDVMAAQAKTFRAVATFLKSVKVATGAEGKKVTVTAEVEKDLMGLMALPFGDFGPMDEDGGDPDTRIVPAPAGTLPAGK